MKTMFQAKYMAIAILASFSTGTIANINPGTILNKTHKAKTNKIIKNFKQNRTANGYIYTSNSTILGNTKEKFKVTIGPHDTQLGSVTGNVNLSFDPTKANCTRGLHLSYSIGSSTPISLSPSCEALLQKEINYSWSHTVASPEVTLPEVPLDGLGIFRVGAKVGAALKVGTNFKAGLKVGGFEKNNDPIYQNGNRRPDIIYASTKPWIAGDVTGKAFAAVEFLGIKRVEKGVKGRLNLINMGTEGLIEGGVTYKPGQSPANTTNGSPYQYYTKLKWTGNAQGGNGDISLYCDVKLFGVWNIFSGSTKIVSWSPIYEYNRTLFDETRYF